jgi:hypothetical protein
MTSCQAFQRAFGDLPFLLNFSLVQMAMSMLVFEPELEAKRPRADARAVTSQNSAGWYFLGLVGVAFALVGGVDLLVAWIPQNFGSPEWEFGTVSQTLDGMPVFALGLGIMLSVAVLDDRRLVIRSLAALFLALGAAIVAMAILYATVMPLALQAVPDPVIKQGLIKAAVKAGTQAVVYTTVFVLLGLKAWRLPVAR